jgi:peptidoglycan/xylan/chitin deacetylase (PgdA/CDA1 family)
MSAAARVITGGRLRTPGAIVFAYHDICEGGHAERYSVTPVGLRAELRAARRVGVRFVKLSELVDALDRDEPLDGMAAVVFDDCLVGVHHKAMSILLELDVPATLFAVTGELGHDPPWWPGSARVMSSGELTEMSDAGFEIGCHTASHPRLTDLDDAALVHELQTPQSRLEDLVGAAVDLFAYPFGEHDKRVRTIVEEAGYRAAFTFRNGRITSELDRYRLPRLNMTGDRGLARFAYHVARPPGSWPDTQLDRTAQETLAS